MDTLQPGGTMSPQGRMWLMDKCLRLLGIWNSRCECAEQAGLLDRARVSRLARVDTHKGRSLHKHVMLIALADHCTSERHIPQLSA